MIETKSGGKEEMDATKRRKWEKGKGGKEGRGKREEGRRGNRDIGEGEREEEK